MADDYQDPDSPIPFYYRSSLQGDRNLRLLVHYLIDRPLIHSFPLTIEKNAPLRIGQPNDKK